MKITDAMLEAGVDGAKASPEARYFCDCDDCSVQYRAMIAAVAPLILEEAAKVAETCPITSLSPGYVGGVVARRIRSLKEQADGQA